MCFGTTASIDINVAKQPRNTQSERVSESGSRHKNGNNNNNTNTNINRNNRADWTWLKWVYGTWNQMLISKFIRI